MNHARYNSKQTVKEKLVSGILGNDLITIGEAYIFDFKFGQALTQSDLLLDRVSDVGFTSNKKHPIDRTMLKICFF